ncbi:MAG: DUF1800 domain-containing protein [Sulfitobacter sp.]
MAFSPRIAEQRFGYGLSPLVAPPADIAQMLAGVAGPDRMQDRFGIDGFRDLQSQNVVFRRFIKQARDDAGTADGAAALEKQKAVLSQVRADYARWFAQFQLRRINTQDGFRERLVAFWGDHFTAMGKQALIRYGAPVFVEEAVRPHVGGRFADMLIAAVRHPLMLHYLDQDSSIGPNSNSAKRRGMMQGLNENLAREVLELHTLGVGGPYTQKDVRALANLLTGLGRTADFSFRFRPNIAEPGVQDVLGVTYDPQVSMARIEEVLGDLAAHPATAAHIAQKLAVHFVSDTPPPDLVAALRDAYLGSDGDLLTVYTALLEHPEAWAPPARNIRPPDEFVSAALRALAVPADVIAGLPARRIANLFFGPLRLMGQDWFRPGGPDGWEEEDVAWVTPQGMAGRLEWAMRVPKALLKQLPEPNDVVRNALGDNPPQKVVFAAAAAESRSEAIGLILMSPAFQRR